MVKNMGGMNKVLAGRTISSYSRGGILSKNSPMHGFVKSLFSLKLFVTGVCISTKNIKVGATKSPSFPHAMFTFQSYLKGK